MSHLGPRVSAYVDGQMPAAEAECAQAHIALCPDCQAQVLAEGAGRRAARQAKPVQAGEELTQRLLALGSEPEQDYLPDGAGSGSAARRGGRLKVLTGAVASVGLVAVALFVLGGNQREVDMRTLLADDDVASSVADRAGSGNDDSALSGTVLDWLRSSGWAAPHELPSGTWVQEVRSTGAGTDTVHVALAGADGGVSMLEQHGELSASARDAMATEMIGGREAYRFGEAWVLQCGDSVVAISSSENPEAARALVAGMPADESPDVLNRMRHGFDVLVGQG